MPSLIDFMAMAHLVDLGDSIKGILDVFLGVAHLAQ